MNSLATALANRLSSSGQFLAVLVDGQRTRHPWPEVHARSQNVAEWLLNDDVAADGLNGEPTVEFISAILGAFQAGAAVSITHTGRSAAPTPINGDARRSAGLRA